MKRQGRLDQGKPMFTIRHVLVWSHQQDKHWVALPNPLRLYSADWEKAASAARKIVGRGMSILAMVEDEANKEAARRLVVGG